MSFPIAVTTAAVMLYGSSPAGTGQLCETGSDWKRMAQAPIVSASVVAPSSRRPMSGVQDRGVSNSDSGRPVPPADPTLPDEGSCKMDSGYFCTHDCQAGYGKKYDVHETCDVVVHMSDRRSSRRTNAASSNATSTRPDAESRRAVAS